MRCASWIRTVLFFKADLYKKYFTLDYKQSLTGKEKSW